MALEHLPQPVMGEGYSINVTLEIGSQYNVTEQVSTFVPATTGNDPHEAVTGYS